MAKKIIARQSFKMKEDQDWSYEDGFGEHIERYDSAKREYYRRSMTFRHHYNLKVNDGRTVVPMDIY